MPDKQLHNNIPALRFPEFKNDGEWEEDTVENLFDFITNNTLSRAELNYENGSYLNVHYGDVLIKFCECLDVKRESLPHISEDKIAQKFCNSILKNGDIVIADTAEDETVGKCTEIVNLTDEFVVPGLHTIAIRPKREFASRYLGFYMNSQSFRNQLSKLMQGVKVLSISKSALRNTIVKFPLSKGEHCKEQNKIAEFLFSLDELLSATKSKLEQLKAYKKGLMQKLFPARGKKLPELRFKEFEKDGEWEVCSLETIFEIKNGYTPSKSNPKFWENGTLPWFRMEDIRLNGHILSDSIQHITPEAVKGSGLFPAYSIIVATTATIGEHALLIVDSLANQRFTFLTKRKSFDEKLDMMYFHYYMFIVDEWCKCNTNSGGLLSVNMPAFKKLRIPYPSNVDEQRKIADSFTSIDEMIKQYTNKAAFLELYKKGLMQQMFPTSK